MRDLAPRWRKVIADLRTERRRLLAMIAAIAVSLAAVGVVLGGYAILSRGMAASYGGTRPASATLVLPGGVDRALADEVATLPSIAAAEARDVVVARARVDGAWRRLLLFVVDDFTELRLARFDRDAGAWPPPDGTMLIERTAAAVLADLGSTLEVRTPHGPPRQLLISGRVHDPGLAPAGQERTGYGYVSRATLGLLGEAPVLHELRVEVSAGGDDATAIAATAQELARWLAARGHPVQEIRIPPPHHHPHQTQMKTVLWLLLSFAAMALVLASVLVATSLAALLARQVRELGVMKALGARTAQLAGLYAAMIVVVGLAAAALATPLSILGARAMARKISLLLNLGAIDLALPPWVPALVIAAGVLVPLAVAAVPIARATRRTVRQALDDHGTGASLRPGLARLPRPLRDLARRPARLALTLGLLAAGGAMFMTALDVSRSWDHSVAQVRRTHHHDVEVRLHTAVGPALAERLAALPGVGRVERWYAAPTAFARPGLVDVVHTYPDGGHGSLQLMAPPTDTRLLDLPLRAGRWLLPTDDDAVVLNHGAAAQAGGARVGDTVHLSLAGQPRAWRVVGVVEELGTAGIAYVTPAAFARAAGIDDRTTMLRLQATGDPAVALATVSRALDDDGAPVASVLPLTELRTAMGEHIRVLVRLLQAMAVVLGAVGVLGLASTTGTSVVERTRELGVLAALGATPRRIARMIAAEVAWVTALGAVLAFALAIPLTLIVDRIVGELGFLLPLPFAMSVPGVLAWCALSVVVGQLAGRAPARRAARLTVRDALATV